MFCYFLKKWKIFNKKKLSIKINFTFPNYPINSFRENNSIYSSCLYDVGCYPISLLTNIGIEITDIQIIKYKYNKKNLKYLKFKICNNDYNINVEIGLKYKYENFVELRNSFDCIKFYPFFSGVKSQKEISGKLNNKKYFFTFSDYDGFEKMFNFDRKIWIKSKNQRFDEMTKTIDTLEIIRKKLSKLKIK